MTVRSTTYSPALDRQQSRDADMLSSISCFEDERGKMHRGGHQGVCLDMQDHDSLDTSTTPYTFLREPGNMVRYLGSFVVNTIKVLIVMKEEGSERHSYLYILCAIHR